MSMRVEAADVMTGWTLWPMVRNPIAVAASTRDIENTWPMPAHGKGIPTGARPPAERAVPAAGSVEGPRPEPGSRTGNGQQARLPISLMAAVGRVALLLTASSWGLGVAAPGILVSCLAACALLCLGAALVSGTTRWSTPVSDVAATGTLRREVPDARHIGQYRLQRLLGSGGMGDVYLAEHLLLKRPCAIKLIHEEKAGDAEALKRFEREVRATARLTHWNTVEIFDYGRSETGAFYYVMEYLPGMNLDQLVRRHGPLPPERAIHLLTQTCEALSEAHAQNLLHRDLKPANIFAAHRGGFCDVAKLLDFGLACPLVSVDLDDVQLTQERAIAGSPLFMSPEQVSGGQPDERSDLYSLGIVAYYLLTGRVPFEGNRPMQVLIAHVHESPRPPSVWKPDVPRDLEAVVLSCLAKDPAHRYPDAGALRAALLACEAAGRWSRERAWDWWQNQAHPRWRLSDPGADSSSPAGMCQPDDDRGAAASGGARSASSAPRRRPRAA